MAIHLMMTSIVLIIVIIISLEELDSYCKIITIIDWKIVIFPLKDIGFFSSYT